MPDFRADQAEGLRRMLDRDRVRVMTVASGSPGVGTTSAVVNIAAVLAARGRRVLVIDENFGPANVAGLLGVRPRFDLHDIIGRQCNLDDALLRGPHGVSILPAASGARALPGLRHVEQQRLIADFSRVDARFDDVLIDTYCGNSGKPGLFSRAAQDIIVVSSAAAPAITDSYALIKRMGRHRGRRRFHLLVNRISCEQKARLIFDNMERVARNHLETRLNSLGCVPLDEKVEAASRLFRPVVEAFPASPSAARFQRIAESIACWPGLRDGNPDSGGLMQRLLSGGNFALANAGA